MITTPARIIMINNDNEKYIEYIIDRGSDHGVTFNCRVAFGDRIMPVIDPITQKDLGNYDKRILVYVDYIYPEFSVIRLMKNYKLSRILFSNINVNDAVDVLIPEVHKVKAHEDSTSDYDTDKVFYTVIIWIIIIFIIAIVGLWAIK